MIVGFLGTGTLDEGELWTMGNFGRLRRNFGRPRRKYITARHRHRGGYPRLSPKSPPLLGLKKKPRPPTDSEPRPQEKKILDLENFGLWASWYCDYLWHDLPGDLHISYYTRKTVLMSDDASLDYIYVQSHFNVYSRMATENWSNFWRLNMGCSLNIARLVW